MITLKIVRKTLIGVSEGSDDDINSNDEEDEDGDGEVMLDASSEFPPAAVEPLGDEEAGGAQLHHYGEGDHDQPQPIVR